jgi:surface protein
MKYVLCVVLTLCVQAALRGAGKRLAFDSDSLKTAVVEWIADAASAKDKYGIMSTWDVSAVTDMSFVFLGWASFNADISGWNTRSCTDMHGMFVRHVCCGE